jgi:accessory gene regulator B
MVMEAISRKIVDSLVAHGNVRHIDRDIYEYGATMALSFVINFAITVAIGFIFGKPLELLMLFLPFIALRTTSGGYHSESFWSCVLTSALAVAATLALVMFTPQIAIVPVSLVLTAGTCFIVFRFAPVEHPNRPLESTEIEKYQDKARTVMVVCAFVVIFFAIVGAERIMLSIALGIALSGVSTVVTLLSHRKEVKLT